MDYGSQVWAPIDSTNIMKLENILKSFSRNIDGLQDKNYWERLKKLKVNSIQRRMERYRILYIWKTITGKVPNYGLKWNQNERRGLMVDIRNYRSEVPEYVKTLYEQTLAIHGGRMFNLLPEEVRCFNGSVDGFKHLLDKFLSNVPDQPQDIGLNPAPVCKETCRNSNSILDWVPYLGIRNRRRDVKDNMSDF